MPTNATDTDSFVANVQRPNNGELADAASLSQGFNPLTQRTRYLYNRTRTNVFDVTRAPYNAVGTVGTDSAPAIQAALNAAGSGGVVVLPAGAYRLDSGLTFTPGVHIVGDPDKTTIAINHASADVFTANGSSSSALGLIEGLRFTALVANTGNVFYAPVTYTCRVQVRNCVMNSANHLGRFFLGISTASEWIFDDCDVSPKGNAAADAYRVDGTDMVLRIRGGRIVMPSTYSSRLVYGVHGQIDAQGVRFDCTAHAGSANAVEILGIDHANLIRGNWFESVFSSGYAIAWAAGAVINAGGNDFKTINTYSGSTLGIGSSLDLFPHYALTVGGTAYTVPSTHRSWQICFTGGSPTVTLSNPLFRGQEMSLTVYNLSGGTWGFSLANYGFKATQPTLSNNTGATARFVAGDPTLSGAISWVQVGGWATISP